MERTCLRCGEKIVGRIDKKFCCDSCRNDYHNALRRQSDKELRPLVNILKRNQKILENQLHSGIRTIPENVLRLKNFDFTHFTSVRWRPFRHTIYYIYDIGYHKNWKGDICIDARTGRA